MSRTYPWVAAAMVVWATPAAAQIDPLLFMKTVPPSVLLVVDTGSRMQRDAPTDPSTPATSLATSSYYDPIVYSRVWAGWEDGLGISDLNTAARYRRRYVGLDHAVAGGDKYTAVTIQTAGDLQPLIFSHFEAPTRLSIARAGLYQAVNENRSVARFGLLRMRQTAPTLAVQGNAGPVAVADLAQQWTETGSILGRWEISIPTVGPASNGASTSAGTLLVAAEVANANATVLSALAKDVRTPGGLVPAGRDDLNTLDAPVKLMLDDAKAEVSRLTNLPADPACRNTIAILVVGGGEGTTGGATNLSLGPAASAFLAVNGNRVPVYVIAIAPPTSDVPGLRSIASASGGQYFEITKAQIDAAMSSPAQIATSGVTVPAGTVAVPEMVKAVNTAIQHAFASESDVNTAPTPLLPFGPLTEYQVTSPIIGTVNLDDAVDIAGAPLVPNSKSVLDKAGVKIPQRSNLMVTTAVSMPGFDGRLRGFRVYRPVADLTKPSGYKFISDGKALWVACVPGTGCAAEPDSSRRNLFTALADGTMIAFTVANAAVLAPLMNLTVADATVVIQSVRDAPIGPIISSTPAVMNPPSLDPPPDDTYPGFAAANAKRRTIVWVGTNHGILEAIDARFGVEVWGFIPHNLLPKLRTLRDGQPVGSFDFFVDSSAKIADVRYGGSWRTHLIIGEGAGGTFYQSLDVTLSDMAGVLGGSDPDSDASLSQVLTYFADPGRIKLNWAFPSYTSFDSTLAPYGDVSASATLVEKSVGQTWSDPAVGQVYGSAGPYAVLVGSGFLPYSQQQRPNRGGVVAGRTFYVIDVEDGVVHDSFEITADGVNETVDDCRANADGCKRIKNALQSDPVATGPADVRFITKAYIADLDGNLWRFDIDLTSGNKPNIAGAVKLYAAGSDQPVFNSMATVNVGGVKQYIFFGTGSDLLPATDKNTVHRLLAVLDNGSSGSKTFEQLLTKVGNSFPLTTDERVTAFPAVAGDIAFFTTTTLSGACQVPTAKLYAFTFIGGPAYDNNGDNKVDKTDTAAVSTIAGRRATAPYVVDQHLVFGAGGEVKLFGDSQDYNNGIGQAGVRILSWRELR